ncbi:MAG: hypothetical protein A3K19_19260 [Lentisphaerae bacterium RIFOXYB12_FULL_65_16]|nr:MAG: hypothetical protein A3K18_11840 [Lentisphaerae bacterium RIFOXYA12_64_32]OGV84664.1 MAG: hypothetical protein A3K19_19260 [Lentisphaerae bacterium RIFOXYB12_FULL_65_16]
MDPQAVSDITTTQTAPAVTARLQAVCGIVRRRQLVHDAIMSLGLMAVAGMVLEALNRLLPLRESWAGGGWLAVLAAGLALLVRGWAAALFRGPTARALALAVEREHPEFMDALVCAVELEAGPAESRRALERVLVSDVAANTAGFDFLAAVFPPHLRLRSLLPPALLFSVIAALALRTPAAAKALCYGRDLLSGAASGLRVSPGDAECPAHSDVRIDVTVERWENEARIVCQTRNQERFEMNRGEGNRHFFTFYDVTEPVRYRVLTPSLASPWHTLQPYYPPVLNAARIRIHPPAYTGREETLLSELCDATVIAGSQVRFELEVEPGVEATLVTPKETLAFSADEPRLRTYECRLTRDLVFRVGLRNPEGRTAQTPEHRLKAEPDLPPVVEALAPRQDVQIRMNQEVELEARASDDFGLTHVVLSYSVSGGTRQEIPLLEPPVAPTPATTAPAGSAGAAAPAAVAPPVLDQQIRHLLTPQQLGLEEGDVVSYFFAAVDNRQPDPQTARSDVYFIVIRPEVKPQDGEGQQGPKKELDISNLIAEAKRLIRLTWDALAVPATDRRRQAAAELSRGLTDLKTETRRTLNEVAQAAGGGAGPIADLFEAAAAEMEKAQALAGRELLQESLPPQERALARLTALENELLKNAAKSGKGQGEGQQSGESQKKDGEPDKENAAKSRQASLAALREFLARLRQLSTRQDELNQGMRQQFSVADSQSVGRGLAEKQRDIEKQAREIGAALERLPDARQVPGQVQSAAGEMDHGAARLDEGTLRTGHQHGQRAHNFLMSAVRALEESYRKASANEIARLAQAAQQLSERQREGAEASRALAEAPTPSEPAATAAQQQQQGLNRGAEQLMSDISQTAGEMEETYPQAAQALQEAGAAARQQNLAGRMTRAANALLYRQFEKARRQQVDCANGLQKLASDLTTAAQHLPALSREELQEAIQRLREAAQEVGHAAEEGGDKMSERLDTVRERVSKDVDQLADAMQDPTLRSIGDELAAPLGESKAAEGAQRLLSLFAAAARVLERQLVATEIRQRVALSRQLSTPPEKYRRLVEEYFKDLSREK